MPMDGDDDALIETTFPGQSKAIVVAPRHIVDQLPHRDLPFIEPLGKFKLSIDVYRAGQRERRAVLKRVT